MVLIEGLRKWLSFKSTARFALERSVVKNEETEKASKPIKETSSFEWKWIIFLTLKFLFRFSKVLKQAELSLAHKNKQVYQNKTKTSPTLMDSDGWFLHSAIWKQQSWFSLLWNNLRYFICSAFRWKLKTFLFPSIQLFVADVGTRTQTELENKNDLCFGFDKVLCNFKDFWT